MIHLSAPQVLTTTVPSPIGTLTLTAVDDELTGLHMADQVHAPTDRDTWREEPTAFRDVVEQLSAYFAGELVAFDLPLRLSGTAFQRQVWEGLRQIPFGETWSYGQLAEKIGNPRACRAVGLANGRNPVAVIVPCHRVIGADGRLTGFGGGLDRKAWLLGHEQQVLAGGPVR